MTDHPYVDEELFGRMVRVETAVEIVAKKFFHRGALLLARDLFDFAVVAENQPDELLLASEFLVRHATLIKAALASDVTNLRLQFDAIDTLAYNPTFDHVCDMVIRRLDDAARHIEEQKRRAAASYQVFISAATDGGVPQHERDLDAFVRERLDEAALQLRQPIDDTDQPALP